MTGISKFRISVGESIGLTNEVIPNIERILKILDPTILPTDIELCFLKAAKADVASSGSEVPKATILIPITTSDIPKNLAK